MLRSSIVSAVVALAFAASFNAAPADVQHYGPTLRVTPSDASTYVARGTMPLPPGTTWSFHCPFGLRRNGTVYPTQWWPVAFHPDGSASVVELAATVPGEPSLPADPGLVDFEIVTSDPPFALTTPQLDSGLVSLLTKPGKLRLRVTDSHGNEYTGDLSQSIVSPASDLEVLGRAKLVYITDELLTLTKGAPGALPYLGGFRAWFTAYDQGRVVELDLRWHNAVLNPFGPMIPDVVFEKVELLLPPDWTATPRWPMPTSGPATNANVDGSSTKVFPIIADGPTPHLLRQRGNLTWRLVLSRAGDGGERDDAIDRRGWGTVQGGPKGWSDPATSNWLPSHVPVPDLSPWEPSITNELRGDRNQIEFAFANGTPYYYAGGLGALGPYHTYGVTYGGMTSGSEIYQVAGTDLVWSGENDGLVAEEMRHRMVLDRQFGWFYDPFGNLVDAFMLEQPDGSLPVNVFNNDFINIANQGDLGFSEAEDVYADVLPRPTYETVVLGTNPYDGLEQHDSQHATRAMYPMKTLVWAANDRMARHDLLAQASLWHMQMHDGPGGRLAALNQWGKEHPHAGGEFGRGEAWILDAVATWYALEWPGKREKLDDWMSMAVETLLELKTPLDVFYGNREGKITEYYEFNKQYAIIQWFEHSIAISTIASVRESWAHDPTTKAALEDLIVKGALAIWRTGSKPGTSGPYEQQAVAWIDPDLPAFTTPQEIPSDGTGGGPDNDQVAGPLGFAARYATGAQAMEVLEYASTLMGSGDPLGALENLTTYYLNLENRAPLVAWLQLMQK
ncbi:hypothetical protein [Engelhardtia mirabilis]|uniref:Uncharacterized protein n=1 Tax=Engelhardtia mirabilis TaxID=2528011 RepID=A0A518BLT4_9BACT|nr:hypothetical protein Pla133_30280 [Planctomycetes bacterium Pla133]QDV02265.1 hypothetical protein Pla86_30270 [Planctomycetes bacterium Pla86]